MLTRHESKLSGMPSTFGQRLELALKLAEKDRSALAEATDLTVQAIGQVIQGKTKALTAENSAKAARFLKVDSYWLATGEGKPRPVGATVAGPDQWPFQRLALDRFLQLTENQQRGIEDSLIKQVDAFLGPAPVKSKAHRKAA